MRDDISGRGVRHGKGKEVFRMGTGRFRAISKTTGEMVQGSLVEVTAGAFIVGAGETSPIVMGEVFRETVGMVSSVPDAEGVPISEGDLVEMAFSAGDGSRCSTLSLVEFTGVMFVLVEISRDYWFERGKVVHGYRAKEAGRIRLLGPSDERTTYTIVGNVHVQTDIGEGVR